MADPMTALSIAATTVQFVDFSLKILSFCREIQNSTKNATEANTEIESSVEKLQEYQKRLKPFAPGQGVSQKDVDTIENARQECNETAGKILKVLRDLKPKKGRWFGDLAWAAWRAHRAEGKIQSLEKKLKGRNARFREALTDVTWERVFHMLKEQEDLIRNRLLPEVKQMRKENEVAHSTTHDQLEKARVTADQKDFLGRLSFPGMSQRHENIEPPATGTYEWIFADDSSFDDSSEQQELRGKFMRWLTSDEKVFWISGKAGSGKSSLMAFIESHRHFGKGLKHWSQGRSLAVLTFFFWRPGVDLQKSITGLLRSLLHQLFMRKPSAIDEVCANDSTLRYSDWTEERLSRVLNEVLDLYQRADECVFFLIDGLDEFEGDYSKLLRTILPIKLRPNVRICLSSRPLDVLQRYLRTCATIRLEDLNYGDIKQYVSTELKGLDYPHKDHLTEIPRRAGGIFLWAALVTKELINCYQEDHSKATLQNVLDDLPQGLAPLFKSLFSQVDRRSHDFLLLIFQLLKGVESSQKVDLAWITACLHHKDILSLQDFIAYCQKVQRQISLRSKGLLEVTSAHDRSEALRGWALEDPSNHKPRQAALTDDETESWMTFAWPKVDWLHRSAYDYIFNSPIADLPTWIREINIEQNLLGGYVWLFKYGLLFFVSENKYDPLESEVGMLTRSIWLQADPTSDDVYQTLDDSCRLLDSSLSDKSWLDSDIQAHLACTKEISCSLIAIRSHEFWLASDDAYAHDYILSRFHVLKHSRFAHLVCGDLLSRGVVRSRLIRPVVEVLTENASSQMSNAVVHTRHERKYRYSSNWGDYMCSWLSRGEICEAKMMVQLNGFLLNDFIRRLPGPTRAFPEETHEQALPDESPASLVSKLITLADHWQLFGEPGHDGGPRKSFLAVHFSLSHGLRYIDTSIETKSSTPLRLLGIRGLKEYAVLQHRTVGFIPLCIFHTSPATNSALARFLVSRQRAAMTSRSFAGSLVAFLECRETLIEEIREDVADQLDARQKRCLLVLVQICFFQHWEIEGMEDVRSIPADF